MDINQIQGTYNRVVLGIFPLCYFDLCYPYIFKKSQ